MLTPSSIVRKTERTAPPKLTELLLCRISALVLIGSEQGSTAGTAAGRTDPFAKSSRKGFAKSQPNAIVLAWQVRWAYAKRLVDPWFRTQKSALWGRDGIIKRGGCVLAQAFTLCDSHACLQGNRAAWRIGGGLYLGAGTAAVVNMSQCQFLNNSAPMVSACVFMPLCHDLPQPKSV